MKNKTTKIFVIIICILVFLIVIGVAFLYYISNREVSGKFVSSCNKVDEEFSTEVMAIDVDTPILFRKVEMVQYYKDSNGNVDLVFSDEPLESFDTYTNPEFPQNIKSEVYYEGTTFNGKELSQEAINFILNSDIDMVKLEDLPIDAGNHLNLIYHDGAYVTASNDWKLGEIRVSFYYLDPNKTYKIKGKIKNHILESIDSITVDED